MSARVVQTPPITPRKMKFGLERSFSRHWNAGDPVETHFGNAFSTLFPLGENFLIKTIRLFIGEVDDPKLRDDVRAFSTEEGAHSAAHLKCNSQLIEQGYVGLPRFNEREERIYQRLEEKHSPATRLAVATAIEHVTAVMGHELLENPDLWLKGADETVSKVWYWHALEEMEHKGVCFDVYQGQGGGYSRRCAAMLAVLFAIAVMVSIRMLYMLRVDGLLGKPSTYLKLSKYFFFGRRSIIPTLIFRCDLFTFFRRDFHPWNCDDRELIAKWSPAFE